MPIARVLVDTPIEGKTYFANSLVDLPAKIAKSLKEGGSIDTSDEAVAYLREQGVEVVKHKTSETPVAESATQETDLLSPPEGQ